MMSQPFFSIVIPTRGRPKYLRDALVSALKQDFEDFEVVVSDNFNDGQTQALLDEFVVDSRFRCVRTERLLNMPEHWEFATQHACGRYVLILTDRSVLKQGTLKAIHKTILASVAPVDACSWRWSLYDENSGSEYGDGSIYKDKGVIAFSSRRLAEEFTQGSIEGTYCLPKGLNSCYMNTFMQRIRDEFGSPFRPISPDFYSAFVIMGTTKEVHFIDESLVVMQGSADSNGGRAMAGIDTGYLNALGEYDIFTQVPIKLPLVKNLILEDFLVVREEIGGYLKGVKCNWPAYFANCYYELLVKKEAGLLSSYEMDGLFAEWERALSTFDQTIQSVARERTEKLIDSFIFPSHLNWLKEKKTANSCLVHFKAWVGEILKGPSRVLGGKGSHAKKNRQSVLEIAGFE